MNRSVLHLFFACTLGALGFTSCITEPDFSDTPRIEFKRVEHYPALSRATTPAFDSLALVIGFEDGDADLGYNQTDQPDLFIFDPAINDTVVNPYYYNYRIDAYVKRNGQFQLIEFPNPAFTYNGRFQRISDSEGGEPLEGEIRYGFIITPSIIRKGDTLRFDIRILDRALHESNQVTTNEVVMKFTN